MGKGTELVVTEKTFPGLYTDFDLLKEVLKANAGEGGFAVNDLDKVKLPTGGSTVWEVPTMEGSDATKEIRGVIIYWDDVRQFWEKPLEETGGNTPPDCYSDDMTHGIGVPGGECATCHFNEFGTATKGEGKGCAEKRRLFILLPDRSLPVVLAGPPSSLKQIRQYLLRLASNARPYYGVLTAFTLEAVKGPVTYSRVNCNFVEALDAETAARAKQFGSAIKSAIRPRSR
jgi:hypothetical protein